MSVDESDLQADVSLLDAVKLAATAAHASATLRPRIADTLERLLFQKNQLANFEWDTLAAIIDSLQSLDLVIALFERYLKRLQMHRSNLFIQPSSSKLPFEIFVAERLRTRVVGSLDLLLNSALRLPPPEAWLGIERIWRNIASWGGYLETDRTFSALLHKTAFVAQGTLRNDPSCSAPILRTLVILEKLDHTHTAITKETLGWCLAVSLRPRLS